MKNFNSILELANEYNTDLKCRKYLEEILWNNKPVCAHCGNEEICSFADGRRFKCKTCKEQFTVTVGTIFEGSHLPLQKWFMGMYLLTAHSNGISSLQLSKDLGITQKSAWYMAHRIRFAIRQQSFLAPFGNTIVEMDETYVRGVESNRHASKRGIKQMKPVFGMVCRNTKQVRTQVVDNTKHETLMPIIRENVKSNSAIITDSSTSYHSLIHTYQHFSVNHSAGEYVRGKVHTNTIENFWSIFKRGYIGTYHQMSVKHLDKYLDEFEFRFNNREDKGQVKLNSVIAKSNGYLSYKTLIAKK